MAEECEDPLHSISGYQNKRCARPDADSRPFSRHPGPFDVESITDSRLAAPRAKNALIVSALHDTILQRRERIRIAPSSLLLLS